MGQHAYKVFYDGACPLCRRELAWIQRHDQHACIEPIDIAADGFRATDHGLDAGQVHAVMHVITPEGQVLRGPAAFRVIYRAIGRGWMAAWTGWPLVKPMINRLYRLFADNRHRLTGRDRPADCPQGHCKPSWLD